ncbi:MAG: hypothetical protein KDB53_17375 [Planctomycetes bacterium]|nr:hypothetical protein [Planctomycetota bacterium]
MGRGGVATVAPLRRDDSRRSGTAAAPRRGPASRLRSADAQRPRISAPAPRARGDRRGRSGDRLGAHPLHRDGYRDRGHRRSNHHSSSISLGLFIGGDRWGFGLGYSEFGHGHSSSFSLGFGGGQYYSSSYLLGTSYDPYWDYYNYGVTPYHLGYASPAHVLYASPAYYGPFRRTARYHFGFSFYSPWRRYSPYPVYRSCFYEPYYLTHYSYVTPVYRTYHYIHAESPVYIETADPYVDEEVVEVSDYYDDGVYMGAGATSSTPVPWEFSNPFVGDFPEGLGYDELLAWGEESLFNGDFLSAAEAFRRAMIQRREDDYPKFQLGLALFAAAKYDESTTALEMGLDQNPAWLHRRFSLADAFSSPAIFQGRVEALERHLIQVENDGPARFLLGYVYYFSGNLFGARSVLKALSETDGSFRHLPTMAREAERRLLSDR